MKVIYLSILCLAVVVMLLAGAVTQAYCYTPVSGEQLAYSAWFLKIIPVGDIVLGIGKPGQYGGRQLYPIICEAKTAGWISLLFKANAVVTAYVDIKKMFPYRFEQVLKVAGKPDDVREAVYDRQRNIMTAKGKGEKRVPADVRDPISAIFYLRTQDLREGAEIKQTVNSNQSNYIFASKVTGKKKIGKFNCWVLDSKIRRENKSMYHSMDAVIYISDDAAQVPVLVEAKTKVGPVTLRLK